jgi:hypothetical protein
MKKYQIFNIVILLLSLSFSIEILSAQNSTNNITFIFKKYDSGRLYTSLSTGEKYVEFEITGYDNQMQLDSLVKHISAYRGVNSFVISGIAGTKIKTGKLTCYKNVENLLYFKHLFFVNNINHLIVDGKEILTENLLDLEIK